MLGDNRTVTKKKKNRKPSDKISLRTNQNYQREAFYENKYNRRNEISPDSCRICNQI